ncbi:hypothetical protein, partial [Pseudomonas aeruginosa]|uniref:hypothetical protein n=1 Tax=Pseudomonas aeruginosa TaxID=287 RepID=UPI002E8E68EE|nr:hypothetical protein [Pseudomonas aeruginosa]
QGGRFREGGFGEFEKDMFGAGAMAPQGLREELHQAGRVRLGRRKVESQLHRFSVRVAAQLSLPLQSLSEHAGQQVIGESLGL